MKGMSFFMTLKKDKIISTIGIILLCFLFHFLYEWIPNTITSIFFPVNESIWEHMKLFISSICFYGIIDYIILSKTRVSFNNFIFNLFITSIASIVIYLLIFLPVYNLIGENMIFSISLMIIVVIISQVISYYILKHDHIKYVNIISLILIIVSYIVFGYLTFHPIHNYIFLDKTNNVYGINEYNI